MNASIGQIDDWRGDPFLLDKCAVQGCDRAAIHGRYCEQCFEEIGALAAMYAKERLRKARREARLYIRFALGQVKRFEWIGTLALVAVCMALILIEFAPWFFDVARRFKDVLMWGK